MALYLILLENTLFSKKENLDTILHVYVEKNGSAHLYWHSIRDAKEMAKCDKVVTSLLIVTFFWAVLSWNSNVPCTRWQK